MAFRRKRRNRQIWLPVNGSSHFNEEPDGSFSADAYGGLTVDGTSGTWDVRGEILPLTVDHQLRPGEETQDTTLSEVMGNEWVLRRIVGNFHIGHHIPVNTPAGTFPCAAQVVAAFFVARSDQTQGDDHLPQGYDGSGALDVGPNQLYNPLDPANSRNPWIWRRRWILGLRNSVGSTINVAQVGVDDAGNCGFAGYTAGYGSMREGGYVDARTIRRIRTDERLWLVVACQRFTGRFNSPPTGSDSHITWTLDYRLLGGLRRARQKGAF